LTLEVKLQFPTPHFLELCSHSSFSPICKSIDITNPSWPKSVGTAYVCNGPFTIDGINSEKIVLRKNLTFWEDKYVNLEKVIITTNLINSELPELFQRRKLDAILFPFCKNRLSESINHKKRLNTKHVTEVRYLGFNCSKKQFANSKLRKAFSLALKRQFLADFFESESYPHYTTYSSEFTQLNLNHENEENQALAKELFFEALDELKLTPDIFNNERIYATPLSNGIEKLIAKQLNDIFDLNLTSIVVNSSNFFSLLRKRKLNLYIYSWINRIQDPSYFLDVFSSAANVINYSCWNNEKLNKLSHSIQETACLKIRKELHYQAEMILHQEKPLVPLITSSIHPQIQPNIHRILIGNSQPFDIRYCYKK